jgi:hypothetical protein
MWINWVLITNPGGIVITGVQKEIIDYCWLEVKIKNTIGFKSKECRKNRSRHQGNH